jgi:ribosomal protein L11
VLRGVVFGGHASDIDAAVKIVMGTARSMGVEVELN